MCWKEVVSGSATLVANRLWMLWMEAVRTKLRVLGRPPILFVFYFYRPSQSIIGLELGAVIGQTSPLGSCNCADLPTGEL